eukprot:scaffold52763_cov55-Phaeocystis_antarctica.AAC.3
MLPITITPSNQAVPATASWCHADVDSKHLKHLEMSNADEDSLRATSIDVAGESEYIQELRKDTLRATSIDVANESARFQEYRKQLMGMDQAELKTELAEIKEEQPD